MILSMPSVASRILLLAFVAFLCGCQREPRSAASDPPPAPPSAPRAPSAPSSDEASDSPRIVVLGDSLTAGLGLVETQAFPHLLQQRIDAEGYDFEVDNAGVSGDTSAGGLRRLDWTLQGDVRVLIVALGANDGLRGLSAAEMTKNLSEIVQRAQDRGIVVILAGMEAPPNFGQEYATAFRQAYREVALQHRVLFIPFLLDKVAGQSTLNQGDGIHPNAQGSQIIAETVWSVLKPLLDQLAAAS
jgi:acyl-CoA thioesterase-1